MNFEELTNSNQQFIPSVPIPILLSPSSSKTSSTNDTTDIKERQRILQQDPSLVCCALTLLARQSLDFFCSKYSNCIKAMTAAPTPPPASSTINPDDEDEDTRMDDEPLENPASSDETTNTDQENEEETRTMSSSIPKIDEDDDRERRLFINKTNNNIILTFFMLLFQLEKRNMFLTLHPDRPHLCISNQYHRLRNTLVISKLFLIPILAFHFQFNHPNKYLLYYLDTLSQ
ncbi:unnamed protein product [Rotaria sordida]|uniref:Uncharacterized protein n=1 Tax=Rotaria sordida TaxID=392033 RepID=A0A819PNL3_9BILA|nr:unnamed protein product [Rotaria sordida]CAF1431569.1 unnamed protein product [Rotaria sordida]CAF3949029.1 unnamed protein product [Rotaria sordida]CAF3985613.1 unnamed protein product [Rotaria sordida]CAF4012178.1 unnamed protein product [Rotaria sordida]